MATELHAARLDTIAGHILAQGGRSLLDLGCGPGELLERILPHRRFERVVGVDIDQAVLEQAKARVMGAVELRKASFCQPNNDFRGFCVATLIETIEHVDPNRLGDLERTVFETAKPDCVFVSTPNQDFNIYHGMRPGQMRHPDHRFEWGRARFRAWARRVAGAHHYQVVFTDIGDVLPGIGASTQMARFKISRQEPGGLE